MDIWKAYQQKKKTLLEVLVQNYSVNIQLIIKNHTGQPTFNPFHACSINYKVAEEGTVQTRLS